MNPMSFSKYEKFIKNKKRKSKRNVIKNYYPSIKKKDFVSFTRYFLGRASMYVLIIKGRHKLAKNPKNALGISTNPEFEGDDEIVIAQYYNKKQLLGTLVHEIMHVLMNSKGSVIASLDNNVLSQEVMCEMTTDAIRIALDTMKVSNIKTKL